MSATHSAPSRTLSLPVPMPPPLSTSSSSTRSSYSFSPPTPSSLTPISPSALKKKASLQSYRSHAHSYKQSISGASTSSGSTSKSFGTSLIEAHNEWKEADDALQRLQLEEHGRDECKAELVAAKEAMRRLTVEYDAAGSPGKRRISRKPSVLTSLFKNKSSAHLPFQDVPLPDTTVIDVTKASVRVTELERETARRTKQVEQTRQHAATLDACYERLKKMIDSGPLPSWQFDEGNETAILRAEKTVTARERSYEDYVTETEVLKRARLAIQSAHHHYTESMNLLDTVCSPSRSGFMAALSDEQSKADAYREAALWSQKAHVCLQECLNVLQPYMELLDGDQVAAAEQLRETGLLQGVRLYELMYGGKALQFGITQQVGIMVKRLDAVYGYLTNLAVGVQNCTEHCQTVQEGARHSRDVARRELVALWMNNSSHASSSHADGRHRHGTV